MFGLRWCLVSLEVGTPKVIKFSPKLPFPLAGSLELHVRRNGGRWSHGQARSARAQLPAWQVAVVRVAGRIDPQVGATGC